jgi:1-acyl-sn-glycerol-3-phosphate acyltransferase
VTLPPYHWWRTVFFLIPVLAVGTIACGTASLLSTFVDRSGVTAHRIAQAWSRLILWTSGVRLERRGAPLPDASTSAVYVANHASFFDIPILFAAVPRQLRIMAKATLGRVPFIGWHLRRAGHLLVDRERPGAAIFKRMQRTMRHGVSLIVFPEGARTLTGDLDEFKAGIFLLAIEHKLPVVPLSLAGSRDVMPRDRLMVTPGPVRVTVHDWISTVDLTRRDARELARRVRAIIAAAS